MAAACNCGNVLRGINVLSLLTHGGIVVAGVYGLLASIRLVQASDVASASGALTVVTGVSGARLGLFNAACSVYFVLLAVLGALAEVRTDCMRRRVLKPIGFLDAAAGRAALLFFLGTLLMLIPWDDRLEIPRIPGGFAIFCSLCQLLVAAFVKEAPPLTGGTAAKVALASARGGGTGGGALRAPPVLYAGVGGGVKMGALHASK